jgi:hypothetical protein
VHGICNPQCYNLLIARHPEYASFSDEELKQRLDHSPDLRERADIRFELERRNQAASEPGRLRRWTRGNKLTAVGVVLAVVALIVAVTVPEIRLKVGLDKPPSSTKPTPDPSQPTIPSKPSETQPKPPSITPLPNPPAPSENRTNFVQNNSSGGGLLQKQTPEETLLSNNWVGRIDTGNGDEYVLYRFKANGAVELKCQKDPRCDLLKARWKLDGGTVHVTFSKSDGEVLVSGHPSIEANGLVGDQKIEGSYLTKDGRTEKWSLTRPELDVRGPTPKK